jgi:hypothetical protein
MKVANEHFMTENFRRSVLASLGANASEIEELVLYNQNVFDHTKLKFPVKLPLPDEPFVAAWEHYTAEAEKKGAFQSLRNKLVQFCFPIQEGISQTEGYRSATRKGLSVDEVPEATGLVLNRPERLKLVLHQSLAGRIPLLITEEREVFVALVRALTMRNEPKPVPDSMGASMIAGYNNWDRVREYRKRWEKKNPSNRSEQRWKEEFQRLIPQKELYQDRFIILSDGPYSAVAAGEVECSEEEWRQASFNIRREHECSHYFTRRMFSSMKNNLIDELIADYMGIVAAAGYFRAGWFLRFLGLGSFPDYREGGRLQNYRGEPSLSDGAFRVLQALVKNAAENLERFDSEHSEVLHMAEGKARMLMALSRLTLEELASKEMPSLLQRTLDGLKKKVNFDVRCSPSES